MVKTIPILFFLVLVAVCIAPVKGQELVYTHIMDTSIYEIPEFSLSVFPGPEKVYLEGRTTLLITNRIIFSYKKKGTDQIDLFSFTGKIGTVTIPNTVNISGVLISQTFVDSDDEWEYIIINFSNSSNSSNPYSFSVVDDDQSVLLSDSGLVTYGFDGRHTYVLHLESPSQIEPNKEKKVWRFRTNVASNAPPSLSKGITTPLHPIMTYGPTGNYRVSLAPSGGGTTTLQLFDMLGRCIFARQIDNVTKPVTFTIPENNVPRSPFVAKVTEGEKSHVRREIPVR